MMRLYTPVLVLSLVTVSCVSVPDKLSPDNWPTKDTSDLLDSWDAGDWDAADLKTNDLVEAGLEVDVDALDTLDVDSETWKCLAHEDCKDPWDCTADSCNQETGLCEHDPRDSECQDDNVCNGLEICDLEKGCQPGVLLECDDGDACNGLEICDQKFGCQNGSAPDCNDGNVCTDDDCLTATGCKHVNNTALCAASKCSGSRFYPAAYCSEGSCPAQVAQECDDGDFCTGKEGCDKEAGCQDGTPPACDDGDPCNGEETCTHPSCQPGTPLECDDGDICNGKETCVQFKGCVVGTKLECDDGDPCNGIETCDPVQACHLGIPLVCVDDDPCNGTETCKEFYGCVAGTPLYCNDDDPCTADACIGGQGCHHSGIDCDDGNICTDDWCDPTMGGCQSLNTNEGMVCLTHDGKDGTCQAGQCIPECTLDADCDDGIECTTGTCNAVLGVCEFSADDGKCDDANPCTDDRCKPSGCVFTDNNAFCDDGNACTTADFCQQGKCLGGPAPVCDDGNACTQDSCDPAIGCMTAAVKCEDGNVCNGVKDCNPSTGCYVKDQPLDCDDKNVCNGLETCDPKDGCMPGQPLSCVDGDLCNGTETCDPLLGCQEGVPKVCDDGDVCNGSETCNPVDGSCVNGVPRDCNDGNPCTEDESCDPVQGCLNHAANEGMGCQTPTGQAGKCKEGTCTPDCVKDGDCDDGVPCTVDSCNKTLWKCQFLADDAVCGDGDVCNGVETCDVVVGCKAGTPLVCDDGNVCNGIETCDPLSGCLDGSPLNCVDADPCNGTETCDPTMGCKAGIKLECDDGNVCNGSETCLKNVGCQSGTALVCEDGNVCNGVKDCNPITGCYVVQLPLDCDDGNLCTDDACDPATGCVHTNNTVQCAYQYCADGTYYPTLYCNAGACPAPTPVDCDDGDVCTDDTCDPVTGCGHTDNTVECKHRYCEDGTYYPTLFCDSGACPAPTSVDCDDGNVCTTDTCNPGTGCANTNNTVFCAASKCESGKYYAAVNCSGGTCPAQTGVTCDDGKVCTTDTCTIGTGCSNALQGGYCLISGTCYSNGQTNPSNTCQACTSTKSTTGWSNATDGTGCTGGTCKGGTCVSSTVTDGFVPIPAGSFWMGSPQSTTCPEGYPGVCEDEASSTYNDDENLHYVQLTRSFEMQAHEVTQGEFTTVMGWNPSYFGPNGPGGSCGTTCPVETVSWYDTVAYANEKSKTASPALTPCYEITDVECEDGTTHGSDYMACMNTTQGGIESVTVTLNGVSKPYDCTGYRLPTESEWEYAARAGSNTAFHKSPGNDGTMTYEDCTLDLNLDQIGNYCGNSSLVGTRPVGGKEPNEWGHYDMSGNVWEWVWDGHGNYPGGTASNPDVDPVVTATGGSNRILRGGSWYNIARKCRSAYRDGYLPGNRNSNLGFRLLRTLPLICGGIDCPTISGYTVTCNAQAHCEYANVDATGWKQWDVWIYIPPGSFTMGSPSSEVGHSSNEDPNHLVTFAKGYLIGKYEVPVLQYEACQAASPSTCTEPSTAYWNGLGWGTNKSTGNPEPVTERLDHPQNGLTWDQAGAVCAWSSGRLPSEAEWEYAATGPVHRKYPWGDTPEPTCANDTAVFDDDGSAGKPWACNSCLTSGCSGTWTVGSKTSGASWSGALDMAGNAWEWCQDWMHDSYMEAPSNGSAWVDPLGSLRVGRGGTFVYGADLLRSSDREDYDPSYGNASIGARCVRDLPITCGDTPCPVLADYKASCNSQDACEYVGGSGAAMVYVPPGPYWMGANQDNTECPMNTLDSGAGEQETPCHQVTVPGFLVDKTEVTESEYQTYYDANGGAFCTNPGDGNACTPDDTATSPFCNWNVTGKDQHPVNCVTWYQMDGYCKGSGKRLCSESEWEKAARGTDGRLYPWGDETATCAYAVMNEGGNGCGTSSTWEVGKKAAGSSSYGVMDMSGNVWEWVEDDWHGNYIGAPTNGSAWVESPRASYRVGRGGGFGYWGDAGLRSSDRDDAVPSGGYGHVGSRCCRSF